jgi:hypothetical protein
MLLLRAPHCIPHERAEHQYTDRDPRYSSLWRITPTLAILSGLVLRASLGGSSPSKRPECSPTGVAAVLGATARDPGRSGAATSCDAALGGLRAGAALRRGGRRPNEIRREWISTLPVGCGRWSHCWRRTGARRGAGVIGKLETTVVSAPAKPGASRTMLCLGFCGGGTGPYLRWKDCVPDDVVLAAVQVLTGEARHGRRPGRRPEVAGAHQRRVPARHPAGRPLLHP